MIISPVEYLLWAINRNTYVAAIELTNLTQWGWDKKLVTVDNSVYPPIVIANEGVQLDELGQVIAKDYVPPPIGEVGPPPTYVEGWHVNMRVYESKLRDAIDAYVPTLTWVQASNNVPASMMDNNGMRYFIPSTGTDGQGNPVPQIKTRRRIWA